MFPPNATLHLLEPPALEPVTLAEAKSFLRIESEDSGDADDIDIGAFIAAARMQAEAINDRTFINTRYRLTLDYLPFSAVGGVVGPALFGFPQIAGPLDDGAIRLPMPPLVSVEALSYTDLDGSSVALDVSPSAGRVVVAPGTPGRIAPGYGGFFPFSRPTIAAVAIDYTAGYGPNPSDVPATIRLAIRLLVAHFYEHRTVDAPAPAAVAALLNATRWGKYA